MALNFRPYVRLTILGGLIVYFGAQALTGERGLLNEAERREALTDRRAELARLEEQLEAGEITEEEFDEQEDALLDRLEIATRTGAGQGDGTAQR